MSVADISGLFPILATPFDEDGSLDEASLRRLVRFEIECGVDGLGLLGYASEAFALTSDERSRILEIVTEEVSGELPLVVGAGGMGARSAIEEILITVEDGADVVMVLPPSHAKPDGERTIEFYDEIAGAVDVPIMVQDAPAITGFAIPSAVLRRLAGITNVDYVKIETQPTAVKVQELFELVGERFGIFGGQNALFCFDEMNRGAIGTMPACEFSDVLSEALRDREAGLKQEALERYHRLLPLIRYGLQPGKSWAIHKEVLRMGGIIESARVRSPAQPLDEATRRGLVDSLSGTSLMALKNTTL